MGNHEKRKEKAYLEWVDDHDSGISELHMDEAYRDYLNEEDIDILGMPYPAGNVLEGVDPVRFRVGFSDWTAENFQAINTGGATVYFPKELDLQCEFEEEMCTVCHTCGEIFLTDEIHLYGTDELCEHCYEDALLGSEYDGEEGKKL